MTLVSLVFVYGMLLKGTPNNGEIVATTYTVPMMIFLFIGFEHLCHLFEVC